jgi:cytochrome c556
MSRIRSRRLALPLLLVVLAAPGIAAAQSPPTKGEQTLKYRKAVYQVMAWNVGPMSAMAKDEAPFDAADFALRADRVAELTPMLAESYSAATKGVAHSKLKPEMWQNRADFDAKLKDLVDRSATLAQVAKGGDPAKSKAAFFDMANACKACHDKYKAD